MNKINILLIIVILTGCVQDNGTPVVYVQDKADICSDNLCQEPPQTIGIMAWNIKSFGMKKANNETQLNEIIKTIEQFDISFIQEIREKEAFDLLCNHLYDYDCFISEALGTTSYKELYGFVYKKGIWMYSTYQSSRYDLFERPPYEAGFRIGNYTLKSYIIHTKPTEAEKEISNLQLYVTSNQKEGENIVVLGDLNADCSYFKRNESDFMGWIWLIQDDIDTTVSENTDCAYDRIIVNKDLFDEVVTSGTIEDITVSDHYPVFVNIKTEE